MPVSCGSREARPLRGSPSAVAFAMLLALCTPVPSPFPSPPPRAQFRAQQMVRNEQSHSAQAWTFLRSFASSIPAARLVMYCHITECQALRIPASIQPNSAIWLQKESEWFKITHSWLVTEPKWALDPGPAFIPLRQMRRRRCLGIRTGLLHPCPPPPTLPCSPASMPRALSMTDI